MYLPSKFPTSILIKTLEEFHKNSAVIWFCDKILWRIPMNSSSLKYINFYYWQKQMTT